MKQDISKLLEEDEQMEDSERESLTFEDLEKEDEFPEEEEEEVEETEEEKEEEKEEEEEEKEKKEEKKTKEKEKEVISSELQAILAHLEKDPILKSKGLEVDVRKLKPEEAKAFLQKGLRFYQAMEELAQKERQIQEELRAREAALANAFNQLQTLSKTEKTSLPKEFEISEDDDPGTVALKKAAAEQWRMAEALKSRVDKLESGLSARELEEQEKKILSEIAELKKDFPLASVEETLAVYALSQGKVPIRQIMSIGHNFYGSADFVRKIFQNCPDIRETIEKEIISNYLAANKKAAAKRVSIKSRGSSAVPSVKAKKPVEFEDIRAALKKHLSSMEEE